MEKQIQINATVTNIFAQRWRGNMYFNDNISNVNSSEAILNRLSVDIIGNAADFTDKVVDSLQQLDKVIGGIDSKTIENVIASFTKQE